jgi:3'-phosphoadenosine 5'-phosphosulfate sulfotransferase (PAPS reductase)/FAD synthetase
VKIIFDEEKIFFENRTGITLPNNCWRDGSKIYLNCKDERPLIVFKVEDRKIKITKNIIKNINEKSIDVKYIKGKKTIEETLINYTLEEEYNQQKDIIRYRERESIDKTKEYLKKYPNAEVRGSDSGGKDSTVELTILDKVYDELRNENYKIDDYIVDFNNTTNDTAQTYKQVKQNNINKNLQTHNPKEGFYPWIEKTKNYYLPSIMVRNCCSTFKEGAMKKVLDKNKEYILVLGMRKNESSKRADYDWDLNEAIKAKGEMKLNVPENWHRFLNVVEWLDEEIWLYLIHENISFNPMYRLGFDRCGCLYCPYSKDYTDLIIEEYYPKMNDRWNSILDKNYELYDVENRLKWTKEEWRNGRWKAGTSKEQYLIQNKATPERIKELAKIKGISEELAEKYFQKKCSCGKKLNPDEVAINLKTYGRGMDVGKMQCKKCFCEANNITGKDYQEKVHSFRNDGCNLF